MSKHCTKQFAAGDHTAFKELYDIHAEKALRLARVITCSDAMAADAVQEAFLRAYVHRSKYDISRPFTVWFNRILVNECRRQLSNNQRVLRLHAPLEESWLPAKHDEPDFMRYEALYSSIESLPDMYRIPLVLKYFHDLSEKEIAAILSINKSTVKSRLYHGRQRMKKHIKPLKGLEYCNE